MKKPSARETINLFIVIIFAAAYAFLLMSVLVAPLYAYKPELYEAGTYRALTNLETLYGLTELYSALSFLSLLAALVYNYYVYAKPANEFTKKHLLAEFLIFIIFFFTLWPHAETAYKTLYYAVKYI